MAPPAGWSAVALLRRYEVSLLVPGSRFYDVSPDGQRFLMVKGDTQAAPRQLRLVVNWFEELKAKVPATP